jgi:hypothetical protein
MPFDPTLPADHSHIVALELRNQFQGLKAIDDDAASQINTLNGQYDSLLAMIMNLPIVPGVAIIVDSDLSDPGTIWIQITSERATGMTMWYQGPGDPDFVEVSGITGLSNGVSGLAAGVYHVKAAGTNSTGTGAASPTVDMAVI